MCGPDANSSGRGVCAVNNGSGFYDVDYLDEAPNLWRNYTTSSFSDLWPAHIWIHLPDEIDNVSDSCNRGIIKLIRYII